MPDSRLARVEVPTLVIAGSGTFPWLNAAAGQVAHASLEAVSFLSAPRTRSDRPGKASGVNGDAESPDAIGGGDVNGLELGVTVGEGREAVVTSELTACRLRRGLSLPSRTILT